MAIKFRKFWQYAVYGSMLSVITLVLSVFGGTKKSDSGYAHISNPLAIPTAQADVPRGAGGEDGEDCEGEGEGECS